MNGEWIKFIFMLNTLKKTEDFCYFNQLEMLQKITYALLTNSISLRNTIGSNFYFKTRILLVVLGK